MAFSQLGCVFGQEVFPTQLWQAGIKNLGPVVLPDKFRGGLVLVDVSQMDDLTAVLDFNLEVSLDGGANFTPIGGVGLDLSKSGYSVNAGVLRDGGGNAVRVYGATFKFPEPGNLTRQVKGQLSLSVAQILGMTMVIW